jgi:hypothetical protein
MSDSRNTAAVRLKLCKLVCALVLAATAAGCDACGNFVPPIRMQGDLQTDACRDSPKPR